MGERGCNIGKSSPVEVAGYNIEVAWKANLTDKGPRNIEFKCIGHEPRVLSVMSAPGALDRALDTVIQNLLTDTLKIQFGEDVQYLEHKSIDRMYHNDYDYDQVREMGRVKFARIKP